MRFSMVVWALLGMGFLQAEKLSTEELVARHLDSIAAAALRRDIGVWQLTGRAKLSLMLGGSGTLEGPVTYISQGDAFRFSIQFNHLNYPEETMVFDGKNRGFSYLEPGVRSQLGQFFYQYHEYINSGLFAGTLNTGWLLHDFESKRARLKYRGVKEVEGRRAHEVEVRMHRGGESTVNLYFDETTFRHVGTLMKLRGNAYFGPDPISSARQTEIRYTFEEWFDRFVEYEGFTIPTNWRFRLSLASEPGSLMTEWEMRLDKIVLNPEITADTFRIR